MSTNHPTRAQFFEKLPHIENGTIWHLHDLCCLDVEELECVYEERHNWQYDDHWGPGLLGKPLPEGTMRTVYMHEGCETPLWLLADRTVEYHSEERLPIVFFGDRLTLRLALDCQYHCGCQTIGYVHSGLHHGAFCYGFDNHGARFNLRDESYVCSAPSHECGDISDRNRKANDAFLAEVRERDLQRRAEEAKRGRE